MEIQRQYNTATTVLFPLVDRGSDDFESTPVTFSAADTQISKDEGTFANTGSTPAHEGNGMYSLALTATEMSAARIMITCIDSATKTWEDQAVLIATYGNSSAQHPSILDTDMSDHVAPGTLGGAVNALAHHDLMGVAQSSGSDHLKLAASASSVDNYYDGMFLVILSAAAGEGQVRQIVQYNLLSKVAAVIPDWETTPSSNATYAILSFPPDLGVDVRKWLTDAPLGLSSQKVQAVT
jgi:hypothetical protein